MVSSVVPIRTDFLRVCTFPQYPKQLFDHTIAYFSLSPCHFETNVAEETAKKVESASVATALAKYDFPVPGGYMNISSLFQAFLIK